METDIGTGSQEEETHQGEWKEFPSSSFNEDVTSTSNTQDYDEDRISGFEHEVQQQEDPESQESLNERSLSRKSFANMVNLMDSWVQKRAETKAEKERLKEARYKGRLVKVHELNEKFMRTNFYGTLLIVFLYFFVGVAVYHNLEDWDYLNCFYFLVITVLTIGYGDLIPTNHTTKLFTAFYILVGITVCGASLGLVSTFWLENQEQVKRKRNLKSFAAMKGQSSDNGGGSEEQHNPLLAAAASASAATSAMTLSKSTDMTKSKRNSRKSIRQSFMAFSQSLTKSPEKSFEEIRNDSMKVYTDEIRSLKQSVVRNLVVIFVVLLIGMGAMYGIEGWTTTDAFYWAIVSLMTVGYGEYHPSSRGGKIFTIFYCIIGCSIIAKAVTDFVRFPMVQRVLKSEKRVVDQFSTKMRSETLKLLFENEFYKLVPDLKRMPDEMSKCEFVLLVLLMMNKVEEKDIFLVAKLFENFDKDQKGFLTMLDMNEKVAEVEQREADVIRRAQEKSNFSAESSAPQANRGSLTGMIRASSTRLRTSLTGMLSTSVDQGDIGNENRNNCNNSRKTAGQGESSLSPAAAVTTAPSVGNASSPTLGHEAESHIGIMPTRMGSIRNYMSDPLDGMPEI